MIHVSKSPGWFLSTPSNYSLALPVVDQANSKTTANDNSVFLHVILLAPGLLPLPTSPLSPPPPPGDPPSCVRFSSSPFHRRASMLDFSFDHSEERPLEAFEDIFASYESKK